MTNRTRLRAFNFQGWLDEHRDLLKPPVGNRQIWEDADLMVTVVGGPNQRTDFHDDPVEEFFYQLEGDMVLKGRRRWWPTTTSRSNKARSSSCHTHVRHSPQRPQEGSIGLVVEPKRPAGARDGFEWYCFECESLVHRAEMILTSIVDDLPPVFERFYRDDGLRTCPQCGAVHPGKTPPRRLGEVVVPVLSRHLRALSGEPSDGDASPSRS